MEEFTNSTQHEDRGPRIPPTKLTSINLEPVISIFYKKARGASLELLDDRFSKDAAMIFCDRIRRDIIESNAKSFTVQGSSKEGFKEILNWIKQCVDESKIVHFRTIEVDTPEMFTKYANAIDAADYLGVPARDFAEGLTKRLIGIARKVLMSWDEVKWFYDKYRNPGLRNVAAASVFFAWWNGKLDEEDTPEEMMILDVMRKANPSLDQDLHDWCEKNEEDVRRKWAEKEAKKDEEAQETGAETEGQFGQVTAGDGWGAVTQNISSGGWGAVPAQNVSSGDWNQDHDAHAAKTTTWDHADITPKPEYEKNDTTLDATTGDWEQTSSKAVPEYGDNDWTKDAAEDNGGGDWADEVNQQAQW